MMGEGVRSEISRVCIKSGGSFLASKIFFSYVSYDVH
jgi:hypothetical protein